MKRTPLKRKTDVPKQSKGLFDHIPKSNKEFFAHLSKPSKDEEWKLVREELKHSFSNVGILSCEARLKGCILSYNFGFGWSFAHSLKRDKISVDPAQREKSIRQVIYACVSCHKILEDLGNKENKMFDEIVDIINKRPKQP